MPIHRKRCAPWSSGNVRVIRWQGPRFIPRIGQTFDTRFLLHAHPYSNSGTTTLCTRASPSSENSPKRKWVSEWSTDGCRYISRKEETRMKEWMEKHRDGKWWERRWTSTRVKTQDTIASPNSLETHLVRKWWEIMHLRTLSPWSNGWINRKSKLVLHICCSVCSNHRNRNLAHGLTDAFVIGRHLSLSLIARTLKPAATNQYTLAYMNKYTCRPI